METPIEELYHSLKKQESTLEKYVDIADLQEAQRIFVKYLILAASSFFEEEIKNHIRDFVSEVSNGNKAIIKFFATKLLNRGYHSIIDWKEKTKLKKFCDFFDADYEGYLKLQDSDMENNFNKFLKLGIDRNSLAHKNLHKHSIENTLDDVFEYYKSAKTFVDSVPTILKTTL